MFQFLTGAGSVSVFAARSSTAPVSKQANHVPFPTITQSSNLNESKIPPVSDACEVLLPELDFASTYSASGASSSTGGSCNTTSSSYIEIRNAISAGVDPILEAVQRCSATLRSIQLSQTVARNGGSSTSSSGSSDAAPSDYWSGDAITLHDFLFQCELVFQRDAFPTGTAGETRKVAYALSHLAGAPRNMAHAALGEGGSYKVGPEAEAAPEWLKSFDGLAGWLCVSFME